MIRFVKSKCCGHIIGHAHMLNRQKAGLGCVWCSVMNPEYEPTDERPINPSRFMSQVQTELQAMRKAGLEVPDLALKMSMDHEVMAPFYSMGITECADLLCELAELR